MHLILLIASVLRRNIASIHTAVWITTAFAPFESFPCFLIALWTFFHVEYAGLTVLVKGSDLLHRHVSRSKTNALLLRCCSFSTIFLLRRLGIMCSVYHTKAFRIRGGATAAVAAAAAAPFCGVTPSFLIGCCKCYRLRCGRRRQVVQHDGICHSTAYQHILRACFADTILQHQGARTSRLSRAVFVHVGNSDF